MRAAEVRIVANVCALAAVIALSGPLPLADAAQVGPSGETAALEQFHQRIEKYLALSRGLRDELPRLVPNSTAAEINTTSDLLAIAIQRARPEARMGDIFDTDASRVLRDAVSRTVRAANLEASLAQIDDEGPTVIAPRIHLRFPAGSPLATMPGALLEVLPRLPPELEYRIIGTSLILRDTNAALIIDFIPRAVPRQ